MVDSVSVRFKNARVGEMPLNIRIRWNAGTACVSECVLKGQRVGVCVSALLSTALQRNIFWRAAWIVIPSLGKGLRVLRGWVYTQDQFAIGPSGVIARYGLRHLKNIVRLTIAIGYSIAR